MYKFSFVGYDVVIYLHTYSMYIVHVSVAPIFGSVIKKTIHISAVFFAYRYRNNDRKQEIQLYAVICSLHQMYNALHSPALLLLLIVLSYCKYYPISTIRILAKYHVDATLAHIHQYI